MQQNLGLNIQTYRITNGKCHFKIKLFLCKTYVQRIMDRLPWSCGFFADKNALAMALKKRKKHMWYSRAFTYLSSITEISVIRYTKKTIFFYLKVLNIPPIKHSK